MSLFQKAFRRVYRELKKSRRMKEARQNGLIYVAPNFLYFPSVKDGAVVVDAGCSYEADFSIYMIESYGAKSFAVDPTMKHREALAALENKYPGKLEHLPIAICAEDGTLTFHESKTNESGSLLDNHVNVRNDETVSYEVEAVTLTTLRDRVSTDTIEILKLDLEGAEYDLLKNVGADDLTPFQQVFVEFHHHAFAEFTEADTKAIVERICNCGFRSFSLDDHNYLFRRITT